MKAGTLPLPFPRQEKNLLFFSINMSYTLVLKDPTSLLSLLTLQGNL